MEQAIPYDAGVAWGMYEINKIKEIKRKELVKSANPTRCAKLGGSELLEVEGY